jgi:NADPH-dependent glutamate synthase beta subunit-like oxidoreductase/coenzyme F420-reducing hydrogenase delta subunit
LVADHEFASEIQGRSTPTAKTHNEKIAVIGAGPAGLTAAHELAKRGYPVTVFDSEGKPGGSLRHCLPEYRLPEEVLDAEIRRILEVGVELRTNLTLGKDFLLDDLKSQGYQATFIATGAHHCASLNIDGEKLGGVFYALAFLKQAHGGSQVVLGDKVVVIGGGNVAMDAARTASRLGPKEVTIVYRRSEKEMPAYDKEVEEAKEEGVKFVFLASPKRILGEDDQVAGLECIKNELGPPDESGRRRPVPVAGSEFVVPASAVMLAIGEMPEVSFLPKEVEVGRGSRIVADPVTLETTQAGIFAGGDTVSGPASVIEAIAAGKRAAVSIDRYIQGLDLRVGRTEKVPELTWAQEESAIPRKPPQNIPRLAPEERLYCFKEVELGFTKEAGLREARRCLFCGPCSECLEPEGFCEEDFALVDEARCIACANCERVCEYGAIKVEKSLAMVNPLLCKGCGTCAVECPAEAIDMQSLSSRSLLSQVENAASSWTAENKKNILAFICGWSLKANGVDTPKNITVIPVKCTGRVDPLHVLRGFNLGADGILVIGCNSKDCHYVFGSPAAEKRIKRIKSWLGAVGVDPDRLRAERSSVEDEEHLRGVFANFTAKVDAMGANVPKTVSASKAD